ncbi:MAG: putative ribonuclease transrane protein [Rhizobacter sp.]|nr:putative ribonuclease transrane protein [Rhizobacter sp.]
MRFFRSPASGSSSGSTFSTSHEPPGRSGASQSSQATPSTISPTRLPTASDRVQDTVDASGGRADDVSATAAADGSSAVFRDSAGARAAGEDVICGIIASMSVPTVLKRNWKQRASRRWNDGMAILLSTLSTWPWLDTVKTLNLRFREDRLGITAGSLTFTTIIALVPLVTVTLAIFTAFPMFATFRSALETWFLQSLVPNNIAQPVLEALTQFASKAKGLGTVGLVFLLFTALALMLTIDRTLNSIWRVAKPRPIAQRVLVYWAAATLGPLLLGVSLTVTSEAVSASRGWTGAMPDSFAWLLTVAGFGLQVLAMAALFHSVPNTVVRWRHATAGGLFVAIGFEVAKRLLAWYVSSVPTYSMLYGTFATVPIFLIWIYFGWVIVLLGAVIAAYAPSLQMRVVRRRVVPGYRFHLAVAMLRQLVRARSVGERGLSAAQISQTLRTDPLQIEPILDLLVGIDWAARLDEAGDARYVLLVDAPTTSATPLLRRMLLDPEPDLQGFWRRAQLDSMSLEEMLAA